MNKKVTNLYRWLVGGLWNRTRASSTSPLFICGGRGNRTPKAFRPSYFQDSFLVRSDSLQNLILSRHISPYELVTVSYRGESWNRTNVCDKFTVCVNFVICWNNPLLDIWTNISISPYVKELFVGIAGFEPAISLASKASEDDLTPPYPVIVG